MVSAVEEERRVTDSGPAVESPNWVLVLVCGVVSLTALWEAISVVRSNTGPERQSIWFDLVGYVALALSGALFAIQAALTPRRPETAARLQTPAVYLTIVGVFLLMLSQSGGRRL
jgi:membrane associated rhomboid family serine protease